jgi:hypothetical protein
MALGVFDSGYLYIAAGFFGVFFMSMISISSARYYLCLMCRQKKTLASTKKTIPLFCKIEFGPDGASLFACSGEGGQRSPERSSITISTGRIEIDGANAPGYYPAGRHCMPWKRFADKILPEGYSYDGPAMPIRSSNSGQLAAFIFMLALVFVFLFLAATV